MGRVFLGKPGTAVYDVETGKIAAWFNTAGELDEDELFSRAKERIAAVLEKRHEQGIGQSMIVCDDSTGETANGAVITVRGDGYEGQKITSPLKDTVFYLRPGVYTYEMRFLDLEPQTGTFTIEEDGSTYYLEVVFYPSEEEVE